MQYDLIGLHQNIERVPTVNDSDAKQILFSFYCWGIYKAHKFD